MDSLLSLVGVAGSARKEKSMPAGSGAAAAAARGGVVDAARPTGGAAVDFAVVVTAVVACVAGDCVLRWCCLLLLLRRLSCCVRYSVLSWRWVLWRLHHSLDFLPPYSPFVSRCPSFPQENTSL